MSIGLNDSFTLPERPDWDRATVLSSWTDIFPHFSLAAPSNTHRWIVAQNVEEFTSRDLGLPSRPFAGPHSLHLATPPGQDCVPLIHTADDLGVFCISPRRGIFQQYEPLTKTNASI